METKNTESKNVKQKTMKKLIDNEKYGFNILIAIFIILVVVIFNTYTLPIIFLAVISLILVILNAKFAYFAKINKNIANELSELNRDILNHNGKIISLSSDISEYNKYLISRINKPFEPYTLEWAIKKYFEDKDGQIIKRETNAWKDKYIFIVNNELIVHQDNSDNIPFAKTETFTEDIYAKDWITNKINSRRIANGNKKHGNEKSRNKKCETNSN